MNSKKPIGIFVIVVALVALAGGVCFLAQKSSDTQEISAPKVPLVSPSFFDAKNSSFTIDGVLITLKNGESLTVGASGSVSETATRYFGNEATGDLNGDGKDDFAFLVTQDGGGSGLFYYAVVLVASSGKSGVANAFFLGDRIAPQSTQISAGKLLVNYAERKSSEAMTASPSVGVTKILMITRDGVLSDGMENWKTATDGKTGMSFKYPERLPTNYTSVGDWPPTFEITDELMICTKTETETGMGISHRENRGEEKERRIIDGRVYCITARSEGAAGSIYTTFTYAFAKGNKTASFTFVLRTVQCANYNNPQKSACEKEQALFTPDGIVTLMANSIKS